jgi:hypothetical protein
VAVAVILSWTILGFSANKWEFKDYFSIFDQDIIGQALDKVNAPGFVQPVSQGSPQRICGNRHQPFHPDRSCNERTGSLAVA